MKVPPQGCQSHGSPPGKSSRHLIIIIHRLRSILQETNKNQSSMAELEIKDFPNWGLKPGFSTWRGKLELTAMEEASLQGEVQRLWVCSPPRRLWAKSEAQIQGWRTVFPHLLRVAQRNPGGEDLYLVSGYALYIAYTYTTHIPILDYICITDEYSTNKFICNIRIHYHLYIHKYIKKTISFIKL